MTFRILSMIQENTIKAQEGENYTDLDLEGHFHYVPINHPNES
jgi:hypothetical protein